MTLAQVALALCSIPPAALATLVWISPELGEFVLQLLLISGYSLTHVNALKTWSRRLAARRMRLKPPEQSFVRFNASIHVRGDTIETKHHQHLHVGPPPPPPPEGEEWYDLNGTRVSPSSSPDAPLPVIVIRTPYNRRLWMSAAMAFAERGYHCLLQDCRGTFGSSGDFFPLANERADGAITIRWLLSQPWCNGRIGFYGISYMGLTSMAAAGSSEGKHVGAVVPVLASSRLHPVLNPGGSVSLELGLRWLYIVLGVDADVAGAYFPNLMRIWRILVSSPKLDRGLLHVPIRDCDSAVCEQKVEFYQEAIRNPGGTEEFWSDKDVLLDLDNGPPPPPLLIYAAWFDFFLAQQLEDYKRASKKQPLTRLIIAPFSHWAVGNNTLSIPAAIDFFETTLKDAKPADGLPVRVSVLDAEGSYQWTSFASWPPAGVTDHTLFLHSSGTLQPSVQDKAGIRKYTFDPAKPTPYVGGASFHLRNCGQMEQTAFERRKDILVYTSLPLGEVAVVGAIRLELYVRSSVQFYDVVSRLCVVTASGRSLNLSDGMTRVTATAKGDVTKVEIAVGACALRLKAGERLRLHVCSGAHPRFMRNYGTGEPIADATTLLKAHQEILHGPEHPSSLTISLLPLSTLSLSRHCFKLRLSTLPSRL